jgi:lysophospholipase L1-like esterase
VRSVLTSMLALSLVIGTACSDDPAAEPVTIIPIGDSLTERVGASTYRCHLDRMLREAGVEFDLVGSLTQPASAYTCPTEFDRDHEAVSGATIDRPPDAALDTVESVQPDVALVLLGTNDLVGQQEPAEVAAELEGFVRDVQRAQPDITILVGQLPPCGYSSDWCQQGWPAFNDEVASFGRLSTDRSTVTVVDMFSDFDLDEATAVAGHPNAAGDEEMARRWMDALTESGAIDRAGG